MFHTLFFFNDTATTEIYTLSLHDALPIYRYHRRALHPGRRRGHSGAHRGRGPVRGLAAARGGGKQARSEEHTSELQSHLNLVCRLLLEKKKFLTLTPWLTTH